MDFMAHWAQRQEAHAALNLLCLTPGLALEGMAQVATSLDLARRELFSLRLSATNREQVIPEDPDAAYWCDFCGQDDPVLLSNDGIDGGPAEWRCTSVAACLARRAEHYPDSRTPQLEEAEGRVAQLSATARTAALALAAWQAALATPAVRQAPRWQPAGRPAAPPELLALSRPGLTTLAQRRAARRAGRSG